MPNLYQDTAQDAVPTPPLDGDVRADVAVVGGGVTGLSTALHLAEFGAKVVLLEAADPGWGASGRNGGQVNPGLKPDPDQVESDFGKDLGGRMNAFAGGAPAFVFALIERLDIHCDARRNGTLRAAVRAKHAAQVHATAEQLARRGAPVELLEGASLERATGTARYALAMLDRRGGDLNPLSYVRGLARAALGAGAAVHGGSRALHLKRSGTAWEITTATGTVSARQVVLATNGYTDDLWPDLRRTIVPVFGAIAATAPLPDAIARGVMPSRAALYESGTVTVYYRVDTNRRLLIGGRGPMREISAAADIPHLLAYARTLWPALAQTPWTHAWGGRLAMTPDHYPHIHEPADGVTVCLGYNGRGVAMGTAMGAQLARRLTNPSAEFDMPITGMKRIRLHALWPLAVRAAIAHARLGDLLG
ncbi:MAG TPA: FAD-binding oxidoreductase [Steroidobacteraceae bacterium]|nr:FAD-binding oxidoreductase [Steroidobacteraceae bacterium]